jgi:hypothetical protein
MSRAMSFGIGLTVVLIGLALFWWIHSMDPGDNTPVAMLIGSVLICPSAILLGRAFWPPGDKSS